MIVYMNYELFMGEALAEARQAAARGAPPVGAIAVMNDAMVARGANRVGEASDPTAHAVIAALREAARKLGTPRLTDVTIFTTLEPCPMCVGALLECDAAALVYAVPNPVCGAAGTVIQLAEPSRPGPAPRGGVGDPARGGRGADGRARRRALRRLRGPPRTRGGGRPAVASSPAARRPFLPKARPRSRHRASLRPRVPLLSFAAERCPSG